MSNLYKPSPTEMWTRLLKGELDAYSFGYLVSSQAFETPGISFGGVRGTTVCVYVYNHALFRSWLERNREEQLVYYDAAYALIVLENSRE